MRPDAIPMWNDESPLDVRQGHEASLRGVSGYCIYDMYMTDCSPSGPLSQAPICDVILHVQCRRANQAVQTPHQRKSNMHGTSSTAYASCVDGLVSTWNSSPPSL